MADKLNFELVSPERRLASSEADAVTIPGMEGDLTAMVGHAPFVSSLRPGFVTVRDGGSEQSYFVTGGFVEIARNTVSVLADEAVEKDEANRELIELKLKAAEEALEEASDARKQAALQKVNDYKTLLGQVQG
ncbi:MAG TPA: ATP synthase F1 subunit epsilon [Thermohalobaculum sp.]|nr:ATP synthase F1 subunit epsilon [Thermohalobaculum sp.]